MTCLITFVICFDIFTYIFVSVKKPELLYQHLSVSLLLLHGLMLVSLSVPRCDDPTICYGGDQARKLIGIIKIIPPSPSPYSASPLRLARA